MMINYFQKISFSASLILILVSLASVSHANAYPRLIKGGHQKVCTDTGPDNLNSRCFAQVITDSSGRPAVSILPSGYGPTQFHTAYQIPNTSVKPGTIAVIDAYDDPNITNDLSQYNSTFGLPVFPTCSKSIILSCFQKINQNGGTSFPQRNSSWALETSLDVETAHEICQNCKLILVEASNSSYNNLMTAVDRARLSGATSISNSYGSSEFSGETSYDSHFNYPGISFVFSSGDSGYGSSYPASSAYVTSAGGTTLNLNSNNKWLSETVWSGTNSGCSIYEARPTYQSDTACLNRTENDISADADPNTGAAVFDSYTYGGNRGWFQVGGTSLSSPIIAGIFGLANNITAGIYANSYIYKNYSYATNLHDITLGSNGTCGSNLCQASNGYDGPSGLGSPFGLGAF
jgi:subtilase family serine protease